MSAGSRQDGDRIQRTPTDEVVLGMSQRDAGLLLHAGCGRHGTGEVCQISLRRTARAGHPGEECLREQRSVSTRGGQRHGPVSIVQPVRWGSAGAQEGIHHQANLQLSLRHQHRLMEVG